MATRVNTRFVVILVVALVAVVGMGSLGVWFLTRNDPNALIAEGDRHLREGQIELAYRAYAQALPYRQDDPVLLIKASDLLPRIQAPTTALAQKQYQQAMAFRRAASQLQPRDAQAAEGFLGYVYNLMREGMGGSALLYDMADGRLAQVEGESNPVAPIAHKYRGIATVVGATPQTPTPRREEARADLEAALAVPALAKDPLTLHHLAVWHLQEAARLSRQVGTQEQVDQHLALARDLSGRAVQAGGEQPTAEQLGQRLEVLTHPLVDEKEAASPVVDALEAQVAAAPAPDAADVLLASRALRALDREPVKVGGQSVTRGLVRARDLVQAAVKKGGDDLALKLHLGELLLDMGEADAALAAFQEVRKAEPRGNFRRTLLADQWQAVAALAAGELLVRQAQAAPDDKAREELIEQAREIADDQRKRGGQSPQVMLLQGQIELAAGDRGAAFNELSKASTAFRRNNPRALLLLAQLLQERGQWGAAIGELERLVQIEPGNILGRLRLAELLLQARRVDEAQAMVAPILEAQPDFGPAVAIRAAILQQQDKPEEAIKLYEEAQPLENPAVLQRLVALYRAAGREADAIKLLDARLAQEPGDVQALEQAMRLEKDPQKAAIRLEAARKAGAPEQQLDALNRVVVQQESLNVADLAQEAIEAEQDPFRRAVMFARFYGLRGMEKEADEALAQAAALNADDPSVIEMQFDQAVQRGELDKARDLANRAATLDLDGAQGMFYRARLEAARSAVAAADNDAQAARARMEDAIRLARAGLSQQPFYNQGHRLLGSMLLQQTRYDEAIDSFRQALAQKPDDLQSAQGLAAAHHGQGERQQALDTLRNVLQFGSRNPQLLNTYLAYEQAYGDPARAVQARQQLAQAAPTYLDNRRQLALLLARQATTDAERDEAIKAAEALVSERPDAIDDVLTLVGVQRVLDRPQDAAATLRSYVQRRGGDVTMVDLLNLARLELDLGEKDAALATFDKAIAMDESSNREAARVAADSLYDAGEIELATKRYEALHAEFPDQTPISLRLAEALLRLNRVADARTLLDSMKGEEPRQQASRRLLLSLIARGEGNQDEAMARLNEAIQADPEMGAARLERGKLLLGGLGSPEQAEADLRAALRLSGDDPTTRLLLARALVRRGERLEAVTQLNRVLASDPQRSEARLALYDLHVQAGDWPAAGRVVQEGLRLSPQDPRWPRLQAQLAARAGQWDQAAQAWSRAADLAPDDPSLLDPLSVAWIMADQPRRALQRLEANKAMVDAEPVLRAVRGRAMFAAGQQDAGLAQLREAVASTTNAVQFTRSLGHAAAVLDPDQLLTLLTDVRDKLPTPAWADLAKAERQLAAGQHAQAVARLEAIDPVSLAPEDQVRRDRLAALAYQLSGEPEKAELAYRRALQAAPDDPQLLNNLAFLLSEDLKRPKDALPLARRAAANQPDSAQVLDTLGWVQHQTGDDRAAQQTLEQSIVQEELPHNRLHLGAVMQSMNRPDAAISHLERALRLANEQKMTDVAQQAQERLTQIEQSRPNGDRP